MENRTNEEIYKSLIKQKRKRITFVVLFILMMLFMAAVSVYFIVFDNIDSFLALFQNVPVKK
jgi:flagellar basal body-associated protein FliL